MNLPWRKRHIEDARNITFTIHNQAMAMVGIVNGMTDGEVTYLTDLYVTPDSRKRGHGTKLMAGFLEAAAGTTVIVLTTDATEFYKRFGFVERTAMVWRKE